MIALRKYVYAPRVDPFAREAPRYVAYCVSQGAAAAVEQRQSDATAHGGKWMRPYVTWIDQQMTIFCKEAGVTRSCMRFADHARFTEWLQTQFPNPFRPL